MANADNTVKQEAKTWIDRINAGNGLSGGWRLESISKRYRYFKSSETGARKRVPVRIRRFARGIPWGLVHEAIRYLESLAPYTDIIFNGERVTLAYRPTNTMWVRDDQHAVDGNAQGTYTLIQDLIEDGSTDDLQTPSSSSCSEEVVSKWVWDASTIEDLPAGGQGVMYSIQAVRRNEDGTFDYALVKRTAKTQHLEESVSECNSFETVTTETWDNVYGTPDAPRDDTGASLPIPEGCSGTDGVTVVRQVSENQDCTMRITVQRHTAKSVVSETSCGKTEYEHTDGETKRAQAAPLGEAPAPTGGKVVTHKSEKRQDGLFDNTVNSKQELPVEKSTLEIRKTLKGVVTSRTDRNQPESSVPPSPSGMRVGETFRSTVTEGGLHDNVHETVDPTPVGDTGGGCNKTVFEETDTQSSNVADKPGDPHGTAGGGTWSEKVLTLTEMGTWDYRTVVHRETAVSGTALELRKTLRGVVRSVTDRNQASASVPSSASSMKVGETYRSTMNPGGSFDNVHEVVENEPVGDTGFGCNKTIFEETDSTAENVAEKPESGHGTAGGGTWTEVSASITEFGTWDKRTVEHHETPVASAVVEIRKTVRGAVRTVTDRNQANATAPSSSAGMAVGETYRSTKTQGGLFDNVHETVDSSPVGDTAFGCNKTIFEETDSSTENVATKPSTAHGTAGGGTWTEVSASITEYGTWDKRTVEHRETSVPSAVIEIRKTIRGAVKTVTDRNQATATAPSSSAGMAVGETYRSTKTQGGLFDNVHETVDSSPVGNTAFGCNKTVFEETDSTTENVPEKPDVEHPAPSGGTWKEISASITEYGTWDKRTVEHRETAQSNAVVEIRKTVRGAIRSTTDRNQASSSVPSSSAGMAVGETYRSTMTQGGLFDNVHEVADMAPVGSIGESCTRTPNLHSHSTSENVKDKPSVEQTSAVNEERSKTARITEYGTWDVETKTVTYQPWGPTAVSTATGPFRTVKTEVFQNVVEAPSRTAGTNEDVSVSVSKNDHGSYDGRIVTETYVPWGVETIATATSTFRTVTIQGFQNLTSVPSRTVGANHEINVSASVNNHGTFDGRITEETFSPWGPQTIATATSTFRTVTIEAFQNNTSVPSRTVGANADIDVSASLNGHGTFDGRIVKQQYTSWGPRLVATVASSFRTASHYAFQNNVEAPSPTAGTNEELSMSVSLNGHGSFDGRYVKEKFEPWRGVIGTATSSYRSITITGFQNQVSAPNETAGLNADLDVSASLNGHGTFDGRIVKQQYEPWGPSLVATTTSSYKSTSHYAFQNVTSAPSPSAGTNEELSMSVSLNGHGTFDGRYTKETFTAWRGTLATATGTYRTTTITGFQNQTSAPNESAGVNADIDVSASLNGHGTFDGRIVKHQYTSWSGTIGTASCPGHTTTITAGMNSTTPPNISGSTGTEVSVSASLNGHGTFDWNARQTTYISTSGQANANWATETSVTVVNRRTSTTNVSPSGKGQASISLDDAGTATTSATSYTPIPVDSNWIEWESEEKAPSHTYKYKCGYRTFCNQSAPPKPPRGSSASIRVSINKFGLYDGTVSYSQLESWENANNDTSDQGSAHAIGYFYVNGKKYKIDGTYRKSIKGWAGTLYHHPGLPGGVYYTAINSITPISSPTGR